MAPKTQKKVLMIDNYDSFTYNVVQYFQQCGAQVNVIRNDLNNLSLLEKDLSDLWVISPGPSNPENAGISLKAVELAHNRRQPLFGVCLGHQCIGAHFGGEVVRASEAMHGKVSDIIHHGKGIFSGLPSPLAATRYHSLVIDRKGFPDSELNIDAHTEDQTIMAVSHKTLPIAGVQFHPESVLTDHGIKMIANALKLIG